MTSPTVPPGTRVGDLLAGGECSRCGAPYERLQEYCLECGVRLPVTVGTGDALGAGVGRPSPWYAGDWFWPVLVTLVVALVTAAAAVALAAARDDSGGPRLVVATGPQPETLTGAAPEAPTTVVAAPNLTLPEEEQPPPQPQAPPPPPAQANAPISWPAGRNGFTVVLASVPEGAGAQARLKAREARSAGLEQVGVLSSSRYSSLHAGYLVVFAGVYPTLGGAQTASAGARERGYQDAYAAQVAR